MPVDWTEKMSFTVTIFLAQVLTFTTMSNMLPANVQTLPAFAIFIINAITIMCTTCVTSVVCELVFCAIISLLDKIQSLQKSCKITAFIPNTFLARILHGNVILSRKHLLARSLKKINSLQDSCNIFARNAALLAMISPEKHFEQESCKVLSRNPRKMHDLTRSSKILARSL